MAAAHPGLQPAARPEHGERGAGGAASEAEQGAQRRAEAGTGGQHQQRGAGQAKGGQQGMEDEGQRHRQQPVGVDQMAKARLPFLPGGEIGTEVLAARREPGERKREEQKAEPPAQRGGEGAGAGRRRGGLVHLVGAAARVSTWSGPSTMRR
jgi:hypothetical protein